MKIYKKKMLKDLTSFRIGGPADIVAEPKDIKELVELVKFARNANYIYYILGNGTNILASDKGLHGLVIHIGSNLSDIKVNGTKIEAQSGALMSEIAQVALKNGLTGFEELSGIPGSVGGAVAMNAGAYEREMSNIVSSVNAINEAGRVVKLTKDKLDFDYRKSAVSEQRFIVTTVTFNLQEGDKENIKERMNKFKTLRENKQPLDMASAGSTFKRPESGFAGLLIEKSNLKGEKVGGAEVSDKHAGFIVNTGNATASDVYKLMQKVREAVRIYYNVLLEPEIKLWGKF